MLKYKRYAMYLVFNECYSDNIWRSRKILKDDQLLLPMIQSKAWSEQNV